MSWGLSARYMIREAVTSDIPVLQNLIEQSVRKLQRNDYTEEQIEGALGHALGLDTQLVEDGTYFVAETLGRPEIVGCGGWSNRATLFGSDHGPNRQRALLDPERDAAKIRAIFVHPNWARKGIGTQLLEHCEAAARTAGFRGLEMGSTLTGVSLYIVRGYRRCEDIQVPLPNGAFLPIVRMIKAISRD